MTLCISICGEITCSMSAFLTRGVHCRPKCDGNGFRSVYSSQLLACWREVQVATVFLWSCKCSLDVQPSLQLLCSCLYTQHVQNQTDRQTDKQADRLCHPSGKFILDCSVCIKRTTAIHASFYPSFSAIILMTGGLEQGVNCSRIEATAHSGAHPRFWAFSGSAVSALIWNRVYMGFAYQIITCVYAQGLVGVNLCCGRVIVK